MLLPSEILELVFFCAFSITGTSELYHSVFYSKIRAMLIFASDLSCVGFQIFVPTNPRGAKTLPPGIIVPETDYMLRRLWGDPSEVCLQNGFEDN